jgi:hypothetical protein
VRSRKGEVPGFKGVDADIAEGEKEEGVRLP